MMKRSSVIIALSCLLVVVCAGSAAVARAQSECALESTAEGCSGRSDCHWCSATKDAYCAPSSQPCASNVPNSLLCHLTNPGSPLGKQHCEELDNPGGTDSPYFQDRGWKYTNPPWQNCTCNRTKFNFVNRVTRNLDGYDNVTFWYLGIQ